MTPGPEGIAASSWLRRSAGDPEPTVRLLCFPHAGGGASSFNSWRRELPGWIELVRVQLPGREDRREHVAHTRIDELIDELFPHVQAMLDLPLVIYGHSVGSLVGFELTRELHRRRQPPPLALIVSSRRAPHRPARDTYLHHELPDDLLADRLEALGGIASGILDGAKRRSHFLPRIRADLSLSDTYVYREAPRLPYPLHAFIGEHDHLVVREDWEAWSEHGSGAFSRRVLPGGHFFAGQSQSELLADVVQIIASTMASSAPIAARSAISR